MKSFKPLGSFLSVRSLFISALLIAAAAAGPALPPDLRPAVAAGDSRGSVMLPVLMYHSLTDDPEKADLYTLPAEQFESDLIWLSDNGFTTVLPSQLSAYAEKGSALPRKPVLITFDDGYADNYFLALPLLRKYHMKAAVSVIGKKADVSSDDLYRNASNSSMSWGEISLLAASGLIEIGSHTYDLHSLTGAGRGAAPMAGENTEAYAQRLRKDLIANSEKISAATGKAPLLFAWPFGACPKNGLADSTLKSLGFKLSVNSYQKINEIKRGDPDSLFGLNRFLRTPAFDISDIIW